MFNGALDRYNWKLLGKREMYIPYNSTRIVSPDATYDKVIRRGHINPEYARYELHRVWVVEATLKAGLRHAFSKRVFYVDEDSWSIAAVDCYDRSEEHTSELQSLMRISYAVFCLKKKKINNKN